MFLTKSQMRKPLSVEAVFDSIPEEYKQNFSNSSKYYFCANLYEPSLPILASKLS